MISHLTVLFILLTMAGPINALSSQSTTQSTSTTTGAITTAGGIGAAMNINSGGIISAGATTASTSVTTGALISGGGLGVATDVYYGGILTGTSTTASTTSTTGAIVTSGGLGVALDVYVGGGITTVNGVTTTSDQRLKENIQELSSDGDTIALIEKLNPVSYTWKESESREMPAGRHAGFLAQEVEAIFPKLVKTDGEGWKSVAYTGLIPYAIDAIQKQQKTIESLEQKAKESEARFAELLKRVKDLEQGAAATA